MFIQPESHRNKGEEHGPVEQDLGLAKTERGERRIVYGHEAQVEKPDGNVLQPRFHLTRPLGAVVFDESPPGFEAFVSRKRQNYFCGDADDKNPARRQDPPVNRQWKEQTDGELGQIADLVQDRIKPLAESGFLFHRARDEAVENVGDGRADRQPQHQGDLLPKKLKKNYRQDHGAHGGQGVRGIRVSREPSPGRRSGRADSQRTYYHYFLRPEFIKKTDSGQ